jgi:hypothetical protein
MRIENACTNFGEDAKTRKREICRAQRHTIIADQDASQKRGKSFKALSNDYGDRPDGVPLWAQMNKSLIGCER